MYVFSTEVELRPLCMLGSPLTLIHTPSPCLLLIIIIMVLILLLDPEHCMHYPLQPPWTGYYYHFI